MIYVPKNIFQKLRTLLRPKDGPTSYKQLQFALLCDLVLPIDGGDRTRNVLNRKLKCRLARWSYPNTDRLYL